MKRTVEVVTTVEVELDETKFTPEFMAEFQQQFYPFTDIETHIEHIGQLAARELLNKDFTEGYGPLADMGIKAQVVDQVMAIS